MATSDTKSGQLDNNDIIFPAPGGGFTRADEYDLDTTAIGQDVTLSLIAKPTNNFDPYLQVIDSETGQLIAESDDIGPTNTNSLITPPNPNAFKILGGIKYKVLVTSFGPLPAQPTTHPYELLVSIPQGNVSLVPRGSTFSGTALKGSPAVTLTGKLDGSKDFTFPAPGGGNTLADEFLVNTSLDGKLLDISLSSTTVGFNPYVEVVDAITGQVVKFADGGGGKNALLTGVLHPANADYRIRVTSNTPFPTATVPDYKLQVTVNQGEVTLTPRSGDTPIPQPNTGPGPIQPPNTGTGPVNTGTDPVNTGSGLLNNTTLPLVFTPVTIATPTINAPGPGNPTGQSANTVTGLFYNLSDGKDDILLFSLPAATGKQILALSGSDKITGTSGADTVNGMQGADTIDGGAGNDSLSGGKESDSLEGGAGDDQILGNNDNDTLTGGEGNDTIRGGKENDSLTGGAGDDFLYGDRNQDFLTGGDGNDTFVLAGGQIAATTLKDADVITDFKTGDKIGLTDGNTFSSLTFEDVSLTLTGQSAVNSTAIKVKADSSYLGIVQGVAKSALTANAFVIL
jgi:hypothetical protein